MVNTSKGIYSIDLVKKETKNIYDGKIIATRLAKVGKNLIATFPGPASGYVDLKTKKKVILILMILNPLYLIQIVLLL